MDDAKQEGTVTDFGTLRKLVIAHLQAYDDQQAYHRRLTRGEPMDDSEAVRQMTDASRYQYGVESTRQALRDALAPQGPLQIGDRVRPTATAQRFLAQGAISDPSTVLAVVPRNGGIRLDPPAPDIVPGGGVPAEWLERIFP